MSVEVSGVSGGWVPSEGTQQGKPKREFYVPVLEGKNHDPTGGTDASPMVRPLWGATSGSAAMETKEGDQMRQGYGDTLTTDICGDGVEGGGNGFQIVQEVGGVRWWRG